MDAHFVYMPTYLRHEEGEQKNAAQDQANITDLILLPHCSSYLPKSGGLC
jgi:hypothetical protein